MEHGSARIGEIFNFGILHLEWPTALFIVIVFFLTVLFLHFLLFRPILRTLAARESEVDNCNGQSEKTNSDLHLLQSDYQNRLVEMREHIQQNRQEALDEALDHAKQLVEKSRSTISAEIEAADKALNEERKSAMKEAESLVADLAQLIRTKVLVN